jgi:RNA polymerase sigma-70 factor (ECF subfamily)
MPEFKLAKQDKYHEHELLKLLADGNEAAFEKLFFSHWDHVYSLSLLFMKSAHLANDISQDVFLSLWKERENLQTVENLKGYLYNSVKFLVHKRFRRMKVEEAYAHFLEHKLSSPQVFADRESYFELKQLQSTIQEGISHLPPQQQRAFKLSRENGLTHDQISQLMGISKKTVKDYIVRSIAFLRPFLKNYGGLLLPFINLFG